MVRSNGNNTAKRIQNISQMNYEKQVGYSCIFVMV